MSFDAHGSRLRALERQLTGPKITAVVIVGEATPEQEDLIRAATAQGRDAIVVQIRLSQERRTPLPPCGTVREGSGEP